MLKIRSLAVSVGVLILSTACTQKGGHDSVGYKRNPAEAQLRKSTPEFCAGIRGNGELIFAHFASLANIVEHYGIIDGISGGSSASITGFIYESMVQNPALWDCPTCTQADFASRTSLLLKSMFAYLDVVKNTSDAQTVFSLIGDVKKLQQTLKDKDLDVIAANDPALIKATAAKVHEVLSSSELRDLVNPELLALLATSDPKLAKYRINEAIAALKTFGKFDASDRRIFFRPGVISFNTLAKRLGRLGNFYAGRGGAIFNQPAVKAFLDRCAPLAKGISWTDLQAKDPSCHTEMVGIMKTYREQLLKAGDDLPDSRLKDPVGKYAHILVSAGILLKPEAAKYLALRTKYLSNDGFNEAEFNIFDALKFGYWGNAEDTQKITANAANLDDLKSKKHLALDDPSWEVALSHSPAEPGLSRFLEIEGSEMISAAGWSDLAPTLVLKNMGCKKIIYVTRRGEDSPFGRGIARNLGMTEAEDNELYALSNPASSLSRSISSADGVWCTNWNAFSVGTQLKELEQDSFNAPFETAQTFSATPLIPYATEARPTHLGCGGTTP